MFKNKSVFLLFFAIFFDNIVIAKKQKHDYGLSISKTGRWLFGKGNPPCDKSLPTLSVANNNIINTKKEWDDFVDLNPLFVLSTADSTCDECCTAEPFL